MKKVKIIRTRSTTEKNIIGHEEKVNNLLSSIKSGTTINNIQHNVVGTEGNNMQFITIIDYDQM